MRSKNLPLLCILLIISIIFLLFTTLWQKREEAQENLDKSIAQYMELQNLIAQIPQNTVVRNSQDIFSYSTQLTNDLHLSDKLVSIQPLRSAELDKEKISLRFEGMNLDELALWLEKIAQSSNIAIENMSIEKDNNDFINLSLTLNQPKP